MRDWVASLLQCTARTLDVRSLLQGAAILGVQQSIGAAAATAAVHSVYYTRTHSSKYAPNTCASQSCVPHLTPSSSA